MFLVTVLQEVLGTGKEGSLLLLSWQLKGAVDDDHRFRRKGGGLRERPQSHR